MDFNETFWLDIRKTLLTGKTLKRWQYVDCKNNRTPEHHHRKPEEQPQQTSVRNGKGIVDPDLQ